MNRNCFKTMRIAALVLGSWTLAMQAATVTIHHSGSCVSLPVTGSPA